jgi:hypothetical protein
MVAINVEMPKNCIFCPLYVGKKGEGHCAITHKWNAVGGLNRLDDCPLVEIGTCKDCKWLTTDEDGNYYCEQTGYFDSLDFYCKDFEKRGDENEAD